MPGNKSEFELMRERRAAKIGISVAELRAHERGLLRSYTYPTKDCLAPSNFQNKEMIETIGHVLECPMCAAQIEVIYRAYKLAKVDEQTAQ